MNPEETQEIDIDIQKALTYTTDIPAIIPEVWSEEVEENARPNRVMRGLIVVNTELLDAPGDTVKIPKLGILVAEDVDEVDEIVPQKWTSNTSVDFKPSEKSAAVEVKKKAVRRSYVNVMEQVTKELGEALATKEDTDIIVAAVAGAGTVIFSNGTGVNDITADDIFTVSLFKDAITVLEVANAPEPYRCLIHPKIKRSLVEDEQFVNASVYGGNAVVMTGEIGEYQGVKVFKSTQATHVTNTVPIEVYDTLFWGARGIAEAIKMEPDFEEDNAVLARATIMASTMEYEVKALNDSQIIVVKSAGGAAPPAP